MNQKEQAIVDQAIEILRKEISVNPITLDSPEASRQFCQLTLADKEHEVFMALFLSTTHQLIKAVEMFRGTIDAALIYPREVAKEALSHNAAAAIFAHNHPSGSSEPSLADQAITRRLVDALGLLDIRVLDHIIVSRSETVSFAERGLL